MLHDNYFEYYENIAHWTFDEYECREECLTDWDLYKILRSLAAPDSHILDLGTAGGEKIFSEFPVCAEILGTDYSPRMIGTARANLAASGRQDVSFEVMDNLKMDVEDEHYDIVVARHTCTDPAQIFRCLEPGGYLLMRGVDKYDCWDLKLAAGYGQGYNDPVPVSVSDYENVLRAGFTDVELVPIHTREYYRDAETLKAFLRVVPILDHMPEDDVLDGYISRNTYSGRVRLIRRFYGITARKPLP